MDIMVKSIFDNSPGNIRGMPIHNEVARGWGIALGIRLKMLLNIFKP